MRFRAWIRLLGKSRIAAMGFSITLLFVFFAIFPHLIATQSPYKIHYDRIAAPPNPTHLFGTDDFGRDVFSRVIFGSRISVYVGLVSVSIAVVLGVPIGLIAAYFGGVVDMLFMRGMDILLAFPVFILAIAIMASMGSSLTNVIIAVGIVFSPQFARIARGSALSVKEKTYVEAARAVGNSHRRVIVKHILPNCISPIIVQITILAAWAIIVESTLSFLGLGAQPPTPSWGLMLSDARGYMEDAPWMAVFPGLAIMMVVLGLNLLGDSLRDMLDPYHIAEQKI